MEPLFGKVLEILVENEQYLAWIESDYLYPGGGGQPCDQAVIQQNGLSFPIHETRLIHGQLMWVIPNCQLKLGEIQITPDSLYRWEVSQQHTAQHIFSGLALQKYGWRSDGFSIFPLESKIELVGADLDLAKYEWLEDQSNQMITQGIPITIYDAKEGDVLRKADNPDHTRVVLIEGVDKCCCSGTHVSRTDQVGGFAILHIERKNKESVRVTFGAGLRLAKIAKQSKKEEKDLKNLLKGDIRERIDILLQECENNREKEKTLISLMASLIPLESPVFRMDQLPLSLESLKYLSLAIQQRGITSSLVNKEGYFVLSGPMADSLFEEFKQRGAKGGGKGVITGRMT
jgi:Ser-tRNA(Ala) deacylase AlaX